MQDSSEFNSTKPDTGMTPDIQLFNKHVEEPGFQIGVDKAMWGIIEDDEQRPTWPFVIIWISAAEKEDCPDRFYFRFNLDKYPAQAPTAYPWDIVKKQKLENKSWPCGGSIVSSVFKTGAESLYLPCDRVAMIQHENWKQEHKNLWWQPHFKITVYLNFVYNLLNSTAYVKN